MSVVLVTECEYILWDSVPFIFSMLFSPFWLPINLRGH